MCCLAWIDHIARQSKQQKSRQPQSKQPLGEVVVFLALGCQVWPRKVFKVLLLISDGEHDATSLLFHGKHGWPMCSRAAKVRIFA
jgi:hypothetical protein